MMNAPKTDGLDETWFRVRVRLRRADKTMTWQTRAAFLLEAEAIEYVHTWSGIAEAEILKPDAGNQRPGTPDGSLAIETRKPGSLK
jgi:hypothetical protein